MNRCLTDSEEMESETRMVKGTSILCVVFRCVLKLKMVQKIYRVKTQKTVELMKTMWYQTVGLMQMMRYCDHIYAVPGCGVDEDDAAPWSQYR